MFFQEELRRSEPGLPLAARDRIRRSHADCRCIKQSRSALAAGTAERSIFAVPETVAVPAIKT
jgi:hypothetical protein